MPTKVPATKYMDEHWRRQTTEYRVTLYTPASDGDWDSECDHYDKRPEAIAAAKAHIETGFPAVVERLVWKEYSYSPDRPESWDMLDGMAGPVETLVYGAYPTHDDDDE